MNWRLVFKIVLGLALSVLALLLISVLIWFFVGGEYPFQKDAAGVLVGVVSVLIVLLGPIYAQAEYEGHW